MVPLAPGDDVQAAVDAHAPGTHFLVKAGVHRRQVIRPKDQMSFVGEPGAVFDGENAAPYAFETLATHPAGVTIQGLIIERYAPPRQNGAIQGDNGQDWVIEDNEICYNANHGLRPGPGARVLRNRVHHNGVLGINGYRADGVLIDGNEVSYNNTSQQPEDSASAEASGIKFLESRNLVIRNNNVHDNYGQGIWIDHGWPMTTIENNTVTGNRGAGIWHEVGYDAVIRNNTVLNNGTGAAPRWLEGAGIDITNSPNVQIYGNTVTNNANGIGVMQASGYSDGPYGPNVVQNLDVHDNVVTMQTGRTGIAENVGDRSVYTSRNNRFSHDSYRLGPRPDYFFWLDQEIDEHRWQSYGQDVTGTFSR